MKKIFILLFFVFLITAVKAKADSITDNAINYLKNNQSTAGQITGGSLGDASPWATIAFSANNIDPQSVKNPTNSLVDYLKNNPPSNDASATEWEKWILAIAASNNNPYDFGGVNYIDKLKSFYNNNQIGDATTVNDDWFGVLSLIAGGVDKSDSVLTDSLNFIVAHQNSDGGYGYSTTAGSDGNDTAAAIQALIAAKNYDASSSATVNDAISKAKIYLLSTQDKSGGFLYDTNSWTTSPDSDSTTWALMALNTLGMGNSEFAKSAKTWLETQTDNDGGFTSCQYNPPDYACTLVSNSTTTSHALIALAGDSWLLKTFDASSVTPQPTTSVTQTPTPTPTPPADGTPTPTSTSGQSSPNNTPTPTATPPNTPTPTPTPTDEPPQVLAFNSQPTPSITQPADPTPTQQQKVLGISAKKESTNQPTQIFLIFAFLTFGIGSSAAFIFKNFNNLHKNQSVLN